MRVVGTKPMSDAHDAGRAILIAGPTASGKSALALALAERLGGVIVNADSMQVYRDLRIITARPTLADEERVPHRLYGHVDAAVNSSVGRYVVDAAAVLAETRREGRPAIFVGGTGLYFKALTAGLAAVPPIPPDIRTGVRERLARDGVPALHAELARRDPATAARLNVNDRTRVSRALEVVEATGRPLAEWQREGLPPLVGPSAPRLFLEPDRAALYARIDARFDAMLSSGGLEEARALAARGLDPALPAMKAHGIPWLIRHLAGEMTLEDAARQAKLDTRHYAKRQFTWFRHQLGDWPRATPEAAFEALMGTLGSPPL
jgi:tRNA dimethylallyltransferase